MFIGPMVTIAGLCSHTQKFSGRSYLSAFCDKKDTDGTKASAADTYYRRQVSDGVGANGPDFYPC